MYAFETIGNATIIVHDQDPVLVTDPWICSEPYFDIWNLSHEIPSAQMDTILRCRYVWLSLAHPDHLNSPSLDKLSGTIILLPDHEGRRIENGMRKEGLNVQVLPTAAWFDVSPRVKVMCLPCANTEMRTC